MNFFPDSIERVFTTQSNIYYTSGTMTENFQITSTMDGLNDLRLQLERIASAWSLSRRQLFEINLVMEEICMNYIEHTENAERSCIGVGLVLENSTLFITITDAGPEFDPTKVAAPDVCLPAQKREPGGLGLYLVRHYINKISYKRINGTNVLFMEKKLN